MRSRITMNLNFNVNLLPGIFYEKQNLICKNKLFTHTQKIAVKVYLVKCSCKTWGTRTCIFSCCKLQPYKLFYTRRQRTVSIRKASRCVLVEDDIKEISK